MLNLIRNVQQFCWCPALDKRSLALPKGLILIFDSRSWPLWFPVYIKLCDLFVSLNFVTEVFSEAFAITAH